MFIWKIGSKLDDLSYMVAAPNWETGLKLVEGLTGPIKASDRKIEKLPELPEGYHLAGQVPCFVEEDQ